MFEWCSIELPGGAAQPEPVQRQVPTIETGESWDRFIQGEERESLERMLPDYLRSSRWFRSKAMHVRAARIADTVQIADEGAAAYLALVNVEYVHAYPETYTLPLPISDATTTPNP